MQRECRMEIAHGALIRYGLCRLSMMLCFIFFILKIARANASEKDLDKRTCT
jgi:hypothetical protein